MPNLGAGPVQSGQADIHEDSETTYERDESKNRLALSRVEGRYTTCKNGRVTNLYLISRESRPTDDMGVVMTKTFLMNDKE